MQITDIPDWRVDCTISREMRSSLSTRWTAGPPASRAAAMLRDEAIAATTGGWWPARLVRASSVLITCASGSSRCGESTTTHRAVSRLSRSRSLGSVGLPVRHTTRVRPVSPTRSRIASSMLTLSLSARIAMAECRWLACALTSSETIVKTCSDQPRITMWPRSMTRERPLRSSSILLRKPEESTPTRVLTMKMPPREAASISAR